MSDYHWNVLSNYKNQIKNSEERFFFSDIRKVTRDKSILLPRKLRENIGTGHDIFKTLCFIDIDRILPYPYTITCIHPQYTSLLGHLADQSPNKRFWGTIDINGRLHLPIDTLETIRITQEAFISAFDDFSWYITDPEEQMLSSRTFTEKLISGEISIPEELLNANRNK